MVADLDTAHKERESLRRLAQLQAKQLWQARKIARRLLIGRTNAELFLHTCIHYVQQQQQQRKQQDAQQGMDGEQGVKENNVGHVLNGTPPCNSSTGDNTYNSSTGDGPTLSGGQTPRRMTPQATPRGHETARGSRTPRISKSSSSSGGGGGGSGVGGDQVHGGRGKGTHTTHLAQQTPRGGSLRGGSLGDVTPRGVTRRRGGSPGRRVSSRVSCQQQVSSLQEGMGVSSLQEGVGVPSSQAGVGVVEELCTGQQDVRVCDWWGACVRLWCVCRVYVHACIMCIQDTKPTR